METALTQSFGPVTVRVINVGNGYRAEILHPDVYGSAINPRILVSPVLGRKLPWKTADGAFKAAVKFAHENYAHLIDPASYWA